MDSGATNYLNTVLQALGAGQPMLAPPGPTDPRHPPRNPGPTQPPPPPPAPPPPPPHQPPPTGPGQMPENNPLAQMLRDIGVRGNLGQAPSINPLTGAMMTGPNPVITSPFRGLFNQGQINQYSDHAPMYHSTLSPDGKYTTQTMDWWKPNATFTEVKDNNDGDPNKKHGHGDDTWPPAFGTRRKKHGIWYILTTNGWQQDPNQDAPNPTG